MRPVLMTTCRILKNNPLIPPPTSFVANLALYSDSARVVRKQWSPVSSIVVDEVCEKFGWQHSRNDLEQSTLSQHKKVEFSSSSGWVIALLVIRILPEYKPLFTTICSRYIAPFVV